MRLAVELYCEGPVYVREGTIFKLGLRARGLVDEGTWGEDCYLNSFLMLTGKRLAGTGRSAQYAHKLLPSGTGAGEAKPGAYVAWEKCSDAAVVVETNLILDPGQLRQMLGLRLVNAEGKAYDIPLARPDIEIAWDGRGRYVIPVGDLLQSKIFAS